MPEFDPFESHEVADSDYRVTMWDRPGYKEVVDALLDLHRDQHVPVRKREVFIRRMREAGRDDLAETAESIGWWDWENRILTSLDLRGGRKR